MSKVLTAVQILAFLAIASFFSLLTFYAHKAAPKISVAIDRTNSALIDIHAIETDTQRMEAEAAGMLNQIRHIAAAENKRTAEQLADAHKISLQAIALFEKLNSTVEHLNATVQGFQDITPILKDGIAQTLSDIHDTLVSSQSLIHAATENLSDPQIKDMMKQLDIAAKNVSDATAEASGALKDVHSATTYELKQLMAPVTKAMVAYKLILVAVQKLFL